MLDIDWRSPAAYEPAKNIPAGGFAWEYLRRHEGYHRDYQTMYRNGGWGGIRTHGGLAPTAVFKTAALNHSATHPRARLKT